MECKYKNKDSLTICTCIFLKFIYFSRWHLPTAENTKCLQESTKEPEIEDKEDTLNEEEEENERQRLNARDEYKDDHRRGWGNRHNRS